MFLIITTFSTLPIEGRSDNILKNTIEQISNKIVSVDIPDPSGSNLLVGAVSASVNVHAPTLFLDYGEGPGPYDRGDVLGFTATITNIDLTTEFYKTLFEVYIDADQDTIPDTSTFIDFFYCGPSHLHTGNNLDWGEVLFTKLLTPSVSQDINTKWLCKSDWPSNTYYTLRVRVFNSNDNLETVGYNTFFINTQTSYNWPGELSNNNYCPGWINADNYTYHPGDPITFEFAVVTSKIGFLTTAEIFLITVDADNTSLSLREIIVFKVSSEVSKLVES